MRSGTAHHWTAHQSVLGLLPIRLPDRDPPFSCLSAWRRLVPQGHQADHLQRLLSVRAALEGAVLGGILLLECVEQHQSGETASNGEVPQ